MKIVNPKREREAILTICESSQKIGGRVLASLSEDHFYHEPTKEAFKRIRKLARTKGVIPDYQDLCSDTTISEDSRKSLLRNKVKPISTQSRAKRLIANLDDFRKMRGLYFDSEQTLDALKAPSLDIDKVLQDRTDAITKLRTNSDKQQQIINLGYKSNSKALIKEVLYGKLDTVIPTGFDDWDKDNRGIPFGALLTLAASSGGGKTALAQQLLLNMTTAGFDGVLVSLEMTQRDNMYRIMSNLAEVPVNKVMAKNLTKNERRAIKKALRKYEKELRRLKTKYSIFAPDEDMTIEEVLFLLKPYKYKVIIIDYISLLKTNGDGVNDWQELGAIARAAKMFAKANDCVVVLLAQLSDDGRVKYAQKIKEDSDVLWAWQYTDENRETGIIDIRSLKARNMVPVNMQLAHDYSIMRIGNTNDKVLSKMRSKQGNERRKKMDDLVRDASMDDDDEGDD